MGTRIFQAIILVLLIIGGYAAWLHYRQEKQLADGAVTCVGCMTPAEKARFDKENSGETADGQSEHKIRTARAEDAAGNPQGAVASGQVAAATTGAGAASTQTAPSGVPVASSNVSSPASPVATPATLPASDSQVPNSPNGFKFAGSGPYMWYRQGNLTWRVDTVNGGSCIAFATMEEWRKQIVSSHGCGRGA